MREFLAYKDLFLVKNVEHNLIHKNALTGQVYQWGHKNLLILQTFKYSYLIQNSIGLSIFTFVGIVCHKRGHLKFNHIVYINVNMRMNY